MIETIVLIPVTDNGGVPFTVVEWEQLETRPISFGGVSREGDVAGVWQSGGRVYRDMSRKYVVALDSWWQLPEWLQLVDWAVAAFRQEAVYVSVAGIPEVRPRT